MRLYMMGSKKTLVPKHKTMCHSMKGGGSPLMLGIHHGAGAVAVPKPVDMSRTKSLLGGLSLQDGKRKKFISI